MTTSSRNRKRKKTVGGTDATEFSRYLDGAYKAAMAKIEAMAAEARESIAAMFHGVQEDEVQGEPANRLCVNAAVHEPHQWNDEEEIYYCDGVSYELIPCARHDVHDEHEWTHPDGRPCWCLGVGRATVQMARNVEILENTPGYPSMQCYVMDEDCFYEYVDDDERWRRVSGGENQVGQEG